MKKLLRALVLTGLVAAPTLAMAAEKPVSPHSLSGNISLTSDYVFRGVSQTQNGPAIQGGIDYAHASGFYAGTWASNVDWVSLGFKNNSSMEIDLYGGYKGSLGCGLRRWRHHLLLSRRQNCWRAQPRHH